MAGVNRRSEKMPPGSVEFTCLWDVTIFKAAIRDRFIAASPCIRITLPKKLDIR